MGAVQDKGRVVKLHMLNQIYSGMSVEDKEKYSESFEKAAAKVMGKGWIDVGYSIESGVQVEYYMRGAMSRTAPVVIDSPRLMKTLAQRLTCGDGSLESFEADSFIAQMSRLGKPEGLGANQKLAIKRLGLGDESNEVLGSALILAGFVGLAGAAKLSEWISQRQEKKRHAIRDKEEADRPINPDDVAWDDVAKVPVYLEKNLSDAVIDAAEQVDGKISGAGIVKRLTWGHQFDQSNPVAFLSRMLAQYESFYHKYEPAVAAVDSFVQADEKSTRPAVMAAKDDNDKVDEILKAANEKLQAEYTKAHTVMLTAKPLFPNARMTPPDVVTKLWSRSVADPAFKDIGEIRPLTKDEAKKMVDVLVKAIGGMKKFTTIFNRRWSDHSDGDDFWDVVERSGHADDYAGWIYWQGADGALLDGVDDISDVLSTISTGVLAWISRSLKTASKAEPSNEGQIPSDLILHALECQSTRLRVLAIDQPDQMRMLLNRLKVCHDLVLSHRDAATENEKLYDTVCDSWYLGGKEFADDAVAISQFKIDLTKIEKGLKTDSA